MPTGDKTMPRGLVFLDRIVWWAVFAACACLLVRHFIFIWLSTMPLTPLSYELRTAIRAYVHPLFDQDWRFFAPEPPTQSSWLVARATYLQRGTLHTTNWVNVTSTLDQTVANNRLSPLAGIHVLISNAMEDYLNQIRKQPGAIIMKKGKRFPRFPIPSRYLPVDLVAMKAAGIVLLRHFYPYAHFKSEQVAILMRNVQPFSKRFKPDRNITSMVLVDWSPAPQKVPTFSIIH